MFAMPVTSVSCWIGVWPGCSSLGTSQAMKNGIHASRCIVVEAGASPPELSAVRAGTGAGLDFEAEPRRGRLELGVGQADSEPSIDAVGGELEQRSTEHRRAADMKIDDRDQLDVGIAERHDAVPGSPARMHAAGHRRQPVIAIQPIPRLVEIRRRRAPHDRSSTWGLPLAVCGPAHRVISRYRRTMRRTRLLVATAVLVQLMHGPAGAADAEPQLFLEGLAFPTNMAFLPDGTLLFTEKETGNVRVVSPEGELLDPPFPVWSIGEANEGDAWRAWIAGGAIAVLVGALGVRFVAGRRLRNRRPSDRDP